MKEDTTKKKIKITDIYFLSTCAIMSALMSVLGPFTIPIGPVPVTLTNLIIYISVYLLGTKGATVSYLIYLLIGLVGLPVFSNGGAGLAKLAGPTGGYLIGFIFMTVIAGVFLEFSKSNIWITGVGMILGTLVAYAFGTAWFVHQNGCTYEYALTLCVYPFIGFDLAKIVIGSLLGKSVRRSLKIAGLIKERKSAA